MSISPSFTDEVQHQAATTAEGVLTDDDFADNREEQKDQSADHGIFDPAPYTKPTPRFDNLASDKIRVTFTGGIDLDPMIADDMAFFDKLMLGRDVDIQVAGTVKRKIGDYKRDDETGEETITGSAVVKIDSVVILTPEQL